MAVRSPLINDGNNLREATSGEITQLKQEMIRQYSLNIPVTLTVVASGGSLGTLADTRKTAGAHSTSTTAFPAEGTTAEPGTTTVNYAKISQTIATVSTPSDTNNKRFPVYYDGTDVVSMSLQDMIDTFGTDVIDTLTNGTNSTDQAGTYRIHTATTLSGCTEVSGSNTAVFVDTRADTSLYTAAGIPETLDQPTTINSYYLFRVNAASVGTIPQLMYADSNNDLKEFTDAEIGTILQEVVRHTAVNVVGSRINYNYTTGTNLGSSMVDTRLDGAGNYQTLFVNADDYRAQEFPNGTAQTINTYNLKANQT